MELDGLTLNPTPLGNAAEAAIAFVVGHVRSHADGLKAQTSRGDYLSSLTIHNELVVMSNIFDVRRGGMPVRCRDARDSRFGRRSKREVERSRSEREGDRKTRQGSLERDSLRAHRKELEQNRIIIQVATDGFL